MRWPRQANRGAKMVAKKIDLGPGLNFESIAKAKDHFDSILTIAAGAAAAACRSFGVALFAGRSVCGSLC